MTGPGKELLQDENVKKAYLGKVNRKSAIYKIGCTFLVFMLKYARKELFVKAAGP